MDFQDILSEVLDEPLDEKRFKVIKALDKRRLAIKKKVVGKIGKAKAASAQFRAKFRIDPKTKRKERRAKPRSLAKQKRMDRLFTKRMSRRKKARGAG